MNDTISFWTSVRWLEYILMRNTVSYSGKDFKYWGVNEAVLSQLAKGDAALYKPRRQGGYPTNTDAAL